MPLHPPDELLTARLRLRPPTMDDAEAIYAHYATDPQVTRFVVWGPHKDVGITRDFLREVLTGRDRGERWPWVIERRADRRLLGMLELFLDGARATLGYVFERPAWGQGYATEAAGAVADWARAEPAVLRLAALCDVRNHPSARVLEKIGLRCEGVRRRAMTHGGTDVLVDVLSYVWVRPAEPGEPQLLELDHVQLAMPPGGEERARAFWRDLLGLRDVPRPAELAGRPGQWFERGAVRVHVGVEEDFRPARKAHPALRVIGYDALLARLAAAGHASKPAETLAGARRAHVHDPFGNRVELIDAEG